MNEVEKLILISKKPAKELAVILETTETRISEYKNNKRAIPLSKLKSWCEILKIDIKNLF